MVSNNAIPNVTKWNVEEYCTLSDHNLIMFSYNENCILRNSPTQESPRFKVKNANWEKFTEKCNETFNEQYFDNLEHMQPDRMINKVTNELQNICKMTIPLIKKPCKNVPWWNTEVLKSRKEAFKIKKELSRARRLRMTGEVENLVIRYRVARNKLTAQIRKSKKNSWRNFVTEIGNEEPWGIVYKMIKDKTRSAQLMTSVFNENNELTFTWEETAQTLLSAMVPIDDVIMEEEIHGNIREENSTYRNSNMEPDISLAEIQNAIERSKNKKAPGIDGISNEIIKAIWKCQPKFLVWLYNKCFIEKYFPKKWKIAELKILLKDKNKDLKLVNSYRPI
ncbi:hypothetical protein KPH14_012936, partial [Odynerus spinipes]